MIGIFDSGSGGLTVLKEIREKLPHADIVYFGDIKNAPYGEKSPEELLALTVNAIALLQERGATSVVSACNSVSAAVAVASVGVVNLSEGQLVEMVGPTVAAFAGQTDRILLVATPATIHSELYQRAFAAQGKAIQTVAIAGLAAAIEFGEAPTALESRIQEALKGVPKGSFDTLILACTHYPLVQASFKRIAGDGVRVFNPAEAVAQRVFERFNVAETEGEGKLQVLLSAESVLFRERVAGLGFSGTVSVEVLA